MRFEIRHELDAPLDTVELAAISPDLGRRLAERCKAFESIETLEHALEAGELRRVLRFQASAPLPDRPAANVPVTPPVIVSNTTPNPGSGTSTTVIHRKPTPRPTAVASNTTKPKAVVKKAPVKKVVVKAKPKSTRHTVRSGENLYNIAKRYGTTVGAVQKANGIKGSVIRPGQSLVIPR